MPRSARILGALLVLGALGSGAATVAGATQPREAGVLLGADASMTITGCRDGRVARVVTAVLPADRFDAGELVWVSGLERRGTEVVPVGARPGAAVPVRLVVDPAVAARSSVVEIRAAGLRDGLPAEIIDRVAVEVACPA